MAVEGFSIPVIDLSKKFEAEKEKLMAAVTRSGCFRVINHGIPEAIMADTKAAVGSIFELPSEVKKRNTDVILRSGYVEPRLVGPFYESFGIYDACSPADILTFCSLLDVSPHIRDILSTYAAKLHDLIMDVASKIAEGLGIVDCSFQEWPSHLRMNRYNFTEESVGACGVKVHTDNSFITVLFEDPSNEGFEIMDSKGNFVAIDPMPGTFLVNIGDIGKVWSNGRLHNVKHRVVCKKAEPRITVVLFLHPPKNRKVEPQAALIDFEHPQLYRSFDYEEYREFWFSGLSADGEVLHRWANE